MNDIKVLKCPSCGGPLDFEDQARSSIKCPYCGTTLSVPEKLQGGGRQEIFGSLSGQVDNIKQIGDLIRGGELQKAAELYAKNFHTSIQDAQTAVTRLAQGKPIQEGGITIRTRSSSAEHPSVFDAGAAAAGAAVASSAAGCGITGAIGLVMVIGVIVAGAVFFAASSENSPLPDVIQQQVEQQVEQIAEPAFASPALTFGGEGNGAGFFTDARNIAIDGEGNIYVSDFETHLVQVFDSNGKFLTQWVVDPERSILSIAASRDGTVFVSAAPLLLVFNGMTGELLDEYDYADAFIFSSLAATVDGGLIATFHDIDGDHVVRFDAQGNPTLVAANVIEGLTGDSELQPLVAVDGLGNIYILGTFNDIVVVLSPEGTLQARFGSDGSEDGQFQAPGAIAVDNQGRIYVSDIKGIQVFDSAGRYLATIDVDASVRDIAFDRDNNLYAVTLDQTVIKFELQE
jgi:outer membrane protein assembly factor BamB/ribosomal protein S27E